MAYALIVALVSLAGAAVPLRARPTHAQLQVYLSIAAGALLGSAMFHLLPEAAELTDNRFGLATMIGLLVVFLMQRYVAPHTHEASADGGGNPHGHDHARHVHAPCDHAEGHEHAHDMPDSGGRFEASGPLLRGLVAIFALSVHSFFDGIAIGAVTSAAGHADKALALSVFLSVLIHKPLDGLSVSVLLISAKTRTRTLWLVQLIYAALVPIGAFAFHMTSGRIADVSAFAGYTLAFSAGTFLSIALTDLLPELQFHRHDRNKLTFAMLGGIAVMFVTSLLD